MKMVFLDGFLVARGDLDLSPLQAFGELTVYPQTAPEERLERIRDADAVFVNRTLLDRPVLEKCPNLRYIGVTGTGYNMVDLQAARERGITVCNSPGYSTGAVAQMTFALLLAIAANVPLFDSYIHAGEWHSHLDETVALTPLIELQGLTLGIVGVGAIGRAVMRTARSFGMRVIGCRRTLAPSGHFICTDFGTVLRESDVITLHCPLTGETRGLIGAREIAQMKDGAILLNTARGGLLDEDAVCDALDSGKLYAAGVDVLRHEPPQEGDRLYCHPRCVVTPHVAWAPYATRARMLGIITENLRLYLAGRPQNVVAGPGAR